MSERRGEYHYVGYGTFMTNILADPAGRLDLFDAYGVRVRHRRPRGSSSSDGGGSLSMRPAATQTASSARPSIILSMDSPA